MRTTICKSFKRIFLDLNSQRTFQKNNLQKIGYNNNNPTRFVNKINFEFDLLWLCYFHSFNNITYIHISFWHFPALQTSAPMLLPSLPHTGLLVSPGKSFYKSPCWQGLHQNVWLHSDLDIGRYKGLRKSYHYRPWCGGGRA